MCSAWARAACIAWPTGSGATRPTSGCWSASTASRARAATSTCSPGRCAASSASSARTWSAAANPIGSPTRWATRCRAYVADMVTLLARLDADSVAWVGTSMGGLIGMGLAALPGSPIGRLVAQRHRPGDRRGRAGAHRRLPRPAAHLGHRGRGRRLPADDLAGLRPALARGMAGADAADAAQGRRSPAPALRPGDRRADARLHRRDGGRRPGRALGRVRRDPLSDAAAARRRLRPAVARPRPRR